MVAVVVDTNVFVAGLRSSGGASRNVIRACLDGRWTPLFANALWSEYEMLLARPVWTSETNPDERRVVLNALAGSGQWIHVYFGWRPNLPDERDNHLVELAIAGGAGAIITHNVRDLAGGELRWQELKVLTPGEALEVLP